MLCLSIYIFLVFLITRKFDMILFALVTLTKTLLLCTSYFYSFENLGLHLAKMKPGIAKSPSMST